MGNTCGCETRVLVGQGQELEVKEKAPRSPMLELEEKRAPLKLQDNALVADAAEPSPANTSAAEDNALDADAAEPSPASTSAAEVLSSPEGSPTASPEGFQARMFDGLVGSGLVPMPVPGKLARHPSSERVTLDEYAARHDDEFKRILALEQPDGWEFKREEQDVRVFTKHVRGVPHMYFKAVTEVHVERGLAHLLSVLLNPEGRTEWDDMCESGRTVQYFPPFYKVSHFRMRSPFAAISPRELVLEGRFRFEEDGGLIISIRSIEHVEVPECSEYVRAKISEGGYIIRPKAESSHVFTITWTGCVDPSGWLPTRITNLAASKQGMTLAKVKSFL